MAQMLYTKYRPKSLKEVLNQDSVINPLIKSIQENNVGSAYLFSGGRGIGKTSIARAFAKDLQIDEADIFELDAASNSGVEDMRKLGEAIQTRPYYSKYKMYIIDEAHMLTKSAANAFLKILEEPPKHVIFVLATTDPQKLPDTIISRCISFVLQKPNLNQIQEYLKEISEKEGFEISDEILRNIALFGDNSYRDSISYLQKVLHSSENKKINFEEVSSILGIVPIESVFVFIKALDTRDLQDRKNALLVLEKIENSKQNIDFFIKNVLLFLREIFFYKFGVKNKEQISSEYGKDFFDYIFNLSENKSSFLKGDLIAKILEAENTSKQSSFAMLPYEILLFE